MSFDWTISVGHIGSFIVFIFGGFGFIWAMRYEIRRVAEGVDTMKARLGALEIELKKMSDVLVELGRQDERLNAMDRRLDDLQHGRGFVLDGLPRKIRSGP